MGIEQDIYTDMVEVNYGWFNFLLRKEDKSILVSASDYLGEDSMQLLLTSVLDILVNDDHIQWVKWYDEPGSRLWRISCVGDYITIEDMIIDIPSYELIDIAVDAITKMSLKTSQYIVGTKAEVVTVLLNLFTDIETNYGVEYYEEHWFDYPSEEILALTEVYHRLP